MANLIKTGNSAMKVGSSIIAYNRTTSYGGISTVISGLSSTSNIKADESANKAYLGTGTSLYIIDLNTNTLITNSISAYTTEIDVPNNILYVGKASSIEVRNLTTYALISTIPIAGYSSLSLDSVNNRLIALSGITVRVINLSNNSLYGSFTLPGYYYGTVAADPNGNRIIAGCHANGTYIYALDTLSLITSMASPAYSSQVNIDLPNNKIIISNYTARTFYFYSYTNPTAGVLFQYGSIGGSEIWGSCLGSQGNFLYVSAGGVVD